MLRADSFWEFMLAREAIRLRRLDGAPREEWTTDPILRDYSFTNVKREHDRTTALLIGDFYSQRKKNHASRVALLNAAIFRYFGTIESARALGWHDFWNAELREKMDRKNAVRMASGERIFTAAYIIPSCGMIEPKHEVVSHIITGIWDCAELILDTNSWAEACARMKGLWGVGSFMAKEVLLDYILITDWKPDDWDTWTPVGPGGRRGAGIVKYDVMGGIPEWEALEVIRELYAMRNIEWPDDMVNLDITDIQFQLCEFAKYEKARHQFGRPKRRFRPTIDSITKGAKHVEQ